MFLSLSLSLISVTVSWRPRQKSPQNLPSAKENEEVLLLVVISVKHCALTVSEITHLSKEKKMLTRFPKQLKISTPTLNVSSFSYWVITRSQLWKLRTTFLKKFKKKKNPSTTVAPLDFISPYLGTYE